MRSKVLERICSQVSQETIDWVDHYADNLVFSAKISRKESFKGILIFLYQIMYK